MENALVWSEANLREPRINCMEGWREVTNLYGNKATRIAERNNPANMRWMRLVTAQTLIMSNGYTLFSDDNRMPSWDHLHNWYDLWDLDFGRPVSKTNRTYHGVKGLFIREFDNGWVIYNRSGRSQTIDFEVPVFTVGGEMGLSHEVADLDGGFFLKR